MNNIVIFKDHSAILATVPIAECRNWSNVDVYVMNVVFYCTRLIAFAMHVKMKCKLKTNVLHGIGNSVGICLI